MRYPLLFSCLAAASLCAAALNSSASAATPWTPGEISEVGPRTVAVDAKAYATVHYVDAGATGKGAGLGTREQPWKSVAAALQAVAVAGADRRIAILVAAGVYEQGPLVLRQNVDVWGGFAAGTWKRDIFKNETVLDGRHANRVVLGADQATLDGFVIRRGRAFGHGGGVLCDNTSPTLSNNRFESCFTVQPADLRADLIHQRGHLGGAVACLYNSVPRIVNNLFRNNWTEIGEGGALALYGWSRLAGAPRALIENNVFVGNVAGTKDLARTRSSSGGAISCHFEASPVIRNNVVAHNRAMGRSDAGGIYCEYFASPEISNNWVVGNEGDDDGGGFYTMRDGEPVLRGNLFAGNWTTMGGVGGLRISKEGRARVIGNVIARNGTGGGIYVADGWVEIANNLVADNRSGPGLRFLQSFAHFQPSRITGNTFAGNETAPITWMENSGVKPVEENNSLQSQALFAKGGQIVAMKTAVFDAVRGWTQLTSTADLGQSSVYAGRAVRVGQFWSIVVRTERESLWLWGDCSTQDLGKGLEILPDYRPASSF